MKPVNPSQALSPFLFWDVSPVKVDFEKSKIWIIKRVLMYGLLQDIKFIFLYYGKKEIANIAINIRELDKRTASFVSLITDTPIENFICCTIKQLPQPHWNF